MDTADELLLKLVEADAGTRPDRQQFHVFWVMNAARPTIAHPGLGGEIEAAAQDIEDLADKGYLRVQRDTREHRHFIQAFDVTPSGVEHARRLQRASEAANQTSPGEPELSWETRVLPVLEAVGRAWARAQPEIGVSLEMVNEELGREPRDWATASVLDELAFTGYIAETLPTDMHPGPAWLRLKEKGYQVTAGWPSASGEVAFERLVALLDERIAAATSEDERSKLEKLRDGVLGVGRDVLTGVLTTSANAAAKGFMT